MENAKILKKVYRSMYKAESDGRNDDFKAYDDMEDMEWQLPWSTKKFVRKRVSAVPNNGLKKVIDLFNTYAPKYDILPRGKADVKSAELLERWLEWEIKQTNMNGAKEPFRQMLKSAAKKGVICAQVDYIPYWLSGEEKEIALKTGAFSIEVHEPDTIYWAYGRKDLRWVAQVSNVDEEFILEQWEEYAEDENNPSIGSALVKVRELAEDQLDKTQRWIYIDYVDNNKRLIMLSPVDYETVSSEDIEAMWGDKDVIVLLDAPNKEGFINWVIAESTGEPLFKSAHKSGSWENDNFLRTVSDSLILRRMYFPILKHQSPSGDALEIDFSGEEAVIEEGIGDKTEVVSPPPLDPGVRELMDRNSGDMSQDLGVSGLQQTQVAGNVQFATVNAVIQLSRTVLDPHIRTFEKSCIKIARMMFRWLDYSGDAVTAYREEMSDEGFQGEKITISKRDFDWRTLNITCELLENTPQDDLQRWNMYAGMLQTGLQIPQSEIMERMELGAPKALMSRWYDEQIENLAFQKFSQKELARIQMEIQEEIQAKQMEQQPQARPAPQQGPLPGDGMGPSPMLDQLGGQGFNTGQGGSSVAEAFPGSTSPLEE